MIVATKRTTPAIIGRGGGWVVVGGYRVASLTAGLGVGVGVDLVAG